MQSFSEHPNDDPKLTFTTGALNKCYKSNI